jgi:ABC-type sulfate transport system permease component
MSLEEAVKFVAGAYGVILAALLVGYAVAARRVASLTRELKGLREAAERRLERDRDAVR